MHESHRYTDRRKQFLYPHKHYLNLTNCRAVIKPHGFFVYLPRSFHRSANSFLTRFSVRRRFVDFTAAEIPLNGSEIIHLRSLFVESSDMFLLENNNR